MTRTDPRALSFFRAVAMEDGQDCSGSVNEVAWETDTELYQLAFDEPELQSLTWTSDLESLKKFVGSCLQQQGKWSPPGGNTKQFKSDNNELVITWYNKKQLTLVFQGQDGPVLKEKLVKLVQDKPETITGATRQIDPQAMKTLYLHSTLTALIEATNSWWVNIDNGLVNGVIFIDLKKAFDTIDHSILT